MSSNENPNNTDHLKIIEGESTIDRKKRLNKLRQQKYRAAQRAKTPEATKAKATAAKAKQRTSQRLTAISEGTSKALESTDTKTLKSSIQMLNELLEKNDPNDLPKIEKILIEAPELVKLIKGHKNCDDLIKQINKREKEVKKNNPKANTPSEKTVKANIGKVKNIYKQFTKKKDFDCKDFSWVRDTDKLIKFFEDNPNWTTDKSENSNRTALASVLRGLDGYQKEYKIISDLSSDIANNKIAKQIGENKLSKKQLKNYLPWDQLVEKTQAAIKRKQTPLKDKALMALYTLRPPRRNDYSEMKVIRTKSNKVTAKTIANLDKKFNYMILDKSDKPKELRFSRYKTEKKYGTQIFDVKNKELCSYL